jgi:hypothetical protein
MSEAERLPNTINLGFVEGLYLARSCHAHSTLPEALREAALAAGGRALHS